MIKMANTSDGAWSIGGNTHNIAVCVDNCLDFAKQVVYKETLVGGSGRCFTPLNPLQNSGALTAFNAANKLSFLLPDGDLGVQCPSPRLTGRVWQQPLIGNPSLNYGFGTGSQFSISAGGDGRRSVLMEFDVPIDLHMTARSFNGNNFDEYLVIRQTTDEYVRGVQSTRLTQYGLQAGQLYSDNNNGSGSAFLWRHVTSFMIDIDSNSGLSCAIHFSVFKTFPGYSPRQCRVPLEIAPPCPGAQRAQTDLMCQQITANPAWFPAFPNGWELSVDGGGSWAPAPVSNAFLPLVPANQIRWRVPFVIPAGYEGFWRVKGEGNLYGGGSNGEFWLDGSLVNASHDTITPGILAGGGQHQAASFWLTPTPGAHVFEFRMGDTTLPGVAAPVFYADYRPIYKTRTPFQRRRCLDGGGAVISEAFTDAEGNPFVPASVITHSITVGDCSGLTL